MQLITIIITRLLFLSSALGLKPVSINSVPRINPDLSNGLKTLRRHFVGFICKYRFLAIPFFSFFFFFCFSRILYYSLGAYATALGSRSFPRAADVTFVCPVRVLYCKTESSFCGEVGKAIFCTQHSESFYFFLQKTAKRNWF